MVHTIKGHTPKIHENVFVAWNAEVTGQVSIAEDASVWFSASIRGDMNSISIGKGSNVQDNCVIHTDSNRPTIVGDNVTIGHGAILHSCTIGNNTTVGMGAIVLDGAKVGANSMVAAGSVVPPGKEFPDNSMIMGSPAKVAREMKPEEIEGFSQNCRSYVAMGQLYRAECK
ncbi:MAG: gamma carbonic anhydrase family protein [Spirochaetaceae bacterium]|nr:gamma carbonic anhydrase family protein [Spirochaetaceae bacterium]